MAPSPTVFARSTDPLGGALSSSPDSVRHDDVQLAGLIVALVIVLVGGSWLGIHFYRKHREARRDKLGVRIPDVAPAPQESMETRARREVSRAQLTASVVLPDRILVTREAGSASDHLTPLPPVSRVPVPLPTGSRRSSLLRPVSGTSTLPQPGPSSQPISDPSVPGPRASRRHGAYRTSTYSTASSISALDDAHAHTRTVRQAFRPTLPDELALAAGERVAVVRTCGDGWCIVGRDSRGRPGDIELGAAPLWAFAAPVEGVVPVRPQRTSSLSIHVTLDTPGGPCFSWTNASS